MSVMSGPPDHRVAPRWAWDAFIRHGDMEKWWCMDDDLAMATIEDLAATADAIAGDASKLAKVRHLASFLEQCTPDELPPATRYFAGSVFPAGDPRTLNVGGAALRNALLELAGVDDRALSESWRRHADSGDVTREVLEGARHAGGTPPLTLFELDAAFAQMAATPGSRAKARALHDLLARASPAAARYVVKLVSGEMRIGLREGLVEDAIAYAFHAPRADVTRAMMLVGDLGVVATLARQRQLGEARPLWFVPLRFMLATPVPDAQEAVARLGDDLWVEDKYDGIRCQLHRRGDRVELYSRDLRSITAQFPEVVADADRIGADVVLDGEILAYRDGTVLPFQVLQSRLGRVAPDAEILRTVPVIYVAWDM